MSQEFAKSFYSSRQWQRCRESFLVSKFYLCEHCKRYGNIVHHKIYITQANLDNPDITLNWRNLVCLCQDCHNLVHNPIEQRAVVDGVMFDANGQLVIAPPENNGGCGKH